MAKLTDATLPVQSMKPAPKPTRTTRRLEVTRHGNDDYTAEEQTLEGDGVNWHTATTKKLCSHVSRNVVGAYVEDWYRLFVGPSFYGDSGL
jgi:hypothetical protein